MDESYYLSLNSLEDSLKTNLKKGLTDQQIKKNLEIYGENCLPKEKKSSLLDLIIEQFNDTLVRILLLAALISGVIIIYLYLIIF